MVIKKLKSRIGLWMMLMMSVLLIAGCGDAEPKNEKLNWKVNVVESKLMEKMAAVDDVRQYDGSIAKVAHNNHPKVGHVFVLVNLDLKKNVSGNHPFVWDKLTLKDAKGKEYKRMQDVFLADYKMQRLSGTDLKLDANGWICFEVHKDGTDKMELVYTENDKKNTMKLKK